MPLALRPHNHFDALADAAAPAGQLGHVVRSGLYARRVTLGGQGMGARTKWYFWPNAAVREFVGLLTEHRLKQGLVLLGLLLSYAFLTILAFA